MPMNQFHNLQKDVSNAILNEVEQKAKDKEEYLKKNPDKTEEDFIMEKGSNAEKREILQTKPFSTYTGG
jgi:hypothetical protein